MEPKKEWKKRQMSRVDVLWLSGGQLLSCTQSSPLKKEKAFNMITMLVNRKEELIHLSLSERVQMIEEG